MMNMEENNTNVIVMEWTRTEQFIEGQYYPSFESKGPDWCYTIYPLVRPKKPEPIGFHFGGWSRKPGDDITRKRIEGEAKTVGECTSICQSHLHHVQST